MSTCNKHAIALLTPWARYAELDYARIYHSMSKPAFVFDGHNQLNHSQLFMIGFNVHAIGKPKCCHLSR